MTLAPPPATTEAPGAGLPPLLLLPPRSTAQPGAVRPGMRGQPRGGAGTGGRWSADRDDTPTGGDTGRRNSRLIARLQSWADQQGGWEVFDSSTGFRLADGSVLSPDAAVVRLERWQPISPEQRRSFPPLCPDLVIELASPSDEGPRGETALRSKMTSYLANGAMLGWLLFPEHKAVEIWRAPAAPASAATPERLEPATLLEESELLPGLRLKLEELFWAV